MCIVGCDLYGLILTPTRELAIQIESHLSSLLKYSTISIGCIVGGMSIAKQKRVLKNSPEIIVATPGRLWQLFENINNDTERLHLRNLSNLRFLVLDEADRLMSSNHFSELKKLLPMIKNIWNIRSTMKLMKSIAARRQQRNDMNSNTNKGVSVWEFLNDDEDEEDEDEDEEDDDDQDGDNKNDSDESEIENSNRNDMEIMHSVQSNSGVEMEFERQIFVVSATLTLESINRNKEVESKIPVFGNLINLVPFEGSPQIIDLTPRHRTTRKVEEYEIAIEKDDKDAMLYYLLLTLHKLQINNKNKNNNNMNKNNDNSNDDICVRTLVFANTIGVVKRLALILKELGLINNVWSLHSQQQQRQRLKNLDRFISKTNSILICSDVAARGLDIPTVNNIIHFQCPLSCEDYIHRTGRVGRTHNNKNSSNNGDGDDGTLAPERVDGQSFLLKTGNDIKIYERIIIALKRPTGLKKYQINERLFENLRKPVKLAKEIAIITDKGNRQQRKVSSLEKMAQMAGIELDEINCRALNIKKGKLSDFQSKSRNKKTKGHHSNLSVYGVDDQATQTQTNTRLKMLRQELGFVLKNEKFLGRGKSSFLTKMVMS